MIAGPSAIAPERLAAEVRALQARYPEAKVFGVYHPSPWTGPTDLEVEGRTWAIRSGATALAVCEALALNEAEGLVILSAVDQLGLPADVWSRLGGYKLHRLDPWDTLGVLFKADKVAPWLRRETALAIGLLSVVPPAGFAAAPGGVLTPDLAWEEFFRRRFDLPDGRPDLETWLEVAADGQRGPRFRAMAPDLGKAIQRRAAEVGGQLAADLVAALQRGGNISLVAGGLLAEIACGPHAAEEDAVRAAAWLEHELGFEGKLPRTLGLVWAKATGAVMARLDPQRRALAHQIAQDWLGKLDARRLAADSSQLPVGLDARLAILGKGLAELAGGRGDVVAVEGALRAAESHVLAADGDGRDERWRMAVRLARSLAARSGTPAADVAEATRRYMVDGGWSDRAAQALTADEPEPALGAAFAAVLASHRALREKENERFAALLVGWNQAPVVDGEVLGIELVLDRLVRPWASQGPVLFVVLDGMDMAAFEALAEDLERRGWGRVIPEGATRPILSMIPTVTSYARTSLLTGVAAAGAQDAERKGFTSHPAVRPSASLPGAVLFHKGDLLDPTTRQLAEGVRTAIEDKRQRVVGVVINAIDDVVHGGDQLVVSWSVEAIRPLTTLLWDAHAAGRAVLLTSDHGHVRDLGAAARPVPGPDRWHPDDGKALAAGELRIAGPRVQAVVGQSAVVVAWSEALRYGSRKNGYHGGVALPEVVVPFGSFVPMARLMKEGDLPPGWRPAPPRTPAWWSPALTSPALPPPLPPEPVTAFGPLFVGQAPAPAKQTWAERVLASEVYLAQRARVPRPLEDEVIKQALALLQANPAGVPARALAAHLEVPEVRLPGLIQVLQRLLNVDGYMVIANDEATGLVRFDADLAARQFGVGLA